jgi:hypothetical protein
MTLTVASSPILLLSRGVLRRSKGVNAMSEIAKRGKLHLTLESIALGR